jgi:pilus assembly protein CpaE
MGQDLKFIVLNDHEEFALQLRTMLLKFEGVKIVAEVDEPALLAQAVSQFPVDILLVNLDPNPEAVLPLIGDMASAHRDLAIFAASESSEGPLILKVMRLGVKEFLPKPIDETALGEAINRITSHRVETVTQGKLITILGTAGGVGATTLSTNLGVELAAIASGNVTVVDLDYRFGQVATLLDVEPTYTLADLCGSPDHLEPSMVTRALAKHSTGLQVLCRPTNFAEADNITTAACMGMFSMLLNMNDYIVADGPTRFDLGAKSILALSDVNLLVVQLLVPCVRNANRILENMRDNGYNLDRTKLVCNRVGRDSGHLSVAHVTETLGLEMFASIPDDWSTVSGAINLGEPLRSHGPKSKVRLAIKEIAERLHRGDSPTDDKNARPLRNKKGFITRCLAQS